MMVNDAGPAARELFAAGDTAGAVTAVIKGIGPRVLSYLRSLLRDEDDVADAYSVFAEAVWRGLPSFRWEASLVTWCYRIAYHAALDVRDQAWRRHARPLVTSEASKLAESMRTKSFVRVERQRAGLEKLLAMLPLEDQSLFALRIGQQLEWGAIAAVLARDGERVDAGTVAKRFSRLKERLSRMAREQGLVE
jgi:RNA polymerase sigma-70 factor (ECF subfamily)